MTNITAHRGKEAFLDGLFVMEDGRGGNPIRHEGHSGGKEICEQRRFEIDYEVCGRR
jgi:hypothetical protein